MEISDIIVLRFVFDIFVPQCHLEKKIFNIFFFNLQGGLSNGWPDQILNEMSTLDSYPAENRYILQFLFDTKCFEN